MYYYFNYLKLNFLIGCDYILRVGRTILTCGQRKPYKRSPHWSPRFMNNSKYYHYMYGYYS